MPPPTSSRAYLKKLCEISDKFRNNGKMLQSPTLDQTLDAALRANPDAFLAIVRAYGPGLRAFLSSQMFHLDDVDDVGREA